MTTMVGLVSHRVYQCCYLKLQFFLLPATFPLTIPQSITRIKHVPVSSITTAVTVCLSHQQFSQNLIIIQISNLFQMLIWAGRDLGKSLVQPSAQSKVSQEISTSFLRAKLSSVLKTSKDKPSTISLGICPNV